MISVVIPLYDKAGQVRATLESVRQQQFTSYEVIIVDDGSTDGSLDVVRGYLSMNIEFATRVRIVEQVHAGVSVARNRGVRESRYEWVAFLDADDVWMPCYLQVQHELSLKYPHCDVLAAGYGVRNGTGQLSVVRLGRLPFASEDGVLENYFEVASCSPPPLTVVVTIVRKRALLAVGGFPEGVTTGEDLLTWARLAVNFKIAYNRRCMGVFVRDPDFFNRDQRERMPATVDLVGGCLEDLFRRCPTTPGLKGYVGLWHKMRARIYLSHSMKREAWVEWRKLVRFSPLSYKTWLYLVLLVSPVKMVS